VEVAKSLTPGLALDIGMGQGRNAVWLAERGWEVTGLDISGEGIRQALTSPLSQFERAGRSFEPPAAPEAPCRPAKGSAGRLRVEHRAAEDFSIGEAEWDLIAGIYVQGVMLRESTRIIAGLRPGGLRVIEGFQRDVMKLGIEGLTGGLLGYKPNALLRHYLPLRIERYEECMALADWRRIEAAIVRLLARKE